MSCAASLVVITPLLWNCMSVISFCHSHHPSLALTISFPMKLISFLCTLCDWHHFDYNVTHFISKTSIFDSITSFLLIHPLCQLKQCTSPDYKLEALWNAVIYHRSFAFLLCIVLPTDTHLTSPSCSFFYICNVSALAILLNSYETWQIALVARWVESDEH